MILFPGPQPWTFVIFWKKWQAGREGLAQDLQLCKQLQL